ncbi:transcriptional regulator protein-like protein [Xylanimonas cellulosilytica DSM 15894]|uniref:Transcriptional regulator protein-like protein n=1 Tax=Xylanimonas cellulosilytica (strain DSM 15894 / JCM 12276 / CECT 5975 / KCTC 9989 / LMG 20990 / NBRC 107835 / XIL07) TaxID=446471 RepID=D1BSW1_XYLCX|nr:transcriptional regulator protein-like protein [Xylanimonas cellulosilytica DSM 15894]
MPPAERLLNLVIALVNTSVSMTKQQVRQGVAGYGDAPSLEAFERMFERDKDTLRGLGVPVVTVDAGGHSDDVGYRIDNEAYALPAIDLTPAELGVLALAAQLWGDKTLRTDTSRAMTKLRAAGTPGLGASGAAEDALVGLAPRVRAVGDAYGPLLDAVTERRTVRFRYRTASTGVLADRRVEPWRIAVRGGGWYLVGRDVDREAPRVFRLSRIEGRVRVGARPGAFAIPDHVDVDAVLGAAGQERVAVLAVVPERASAVRARAVEVPAHVPPVPEGFDVVAIPFRSVTTLAEELAGYADAVVVLAPPELRADVVRRLQAAAALGASTGSDDEEGSRG